MLDIRTCMEERLLSQVSSHNDELIDMMLESDADEVFFISTCDYFKFKKNGKKLSGVWHLSCSFELGRLFTETGMDFTLYGFSRKLPKTVRFAHWKGNNCPSNKLNKTGDLTYIEFTDEYLQYLHECEILANEGKTSGERAYAEFVILASNNVVEGKWEASFYNKKNRNLRKMVSKEQTVALSEVAQVLAPRCVRSADGKSPTLTAKEITFPFERGNISLGEGSDVELKKGDIVLQVMGKANKAMVYYGDEGVYASRTLAVIRPTGKLSSEYLCLYLLSDLAKDILASLQSGLAIKRITNSDLKALPVVIPALGDQYYQAIYSKLSNPQKRDYIELETLKTGKASEAEGLLDEELANNIKTFNRERLETFLTSDMREINTCFAHGAYKASIILAGSVLEAILIDWLSEIKNIDYFKNDFMVKHKDGKCRRATLYDYIDAIEVLERPNWANEAQMAHAIREKRNLVHAKLCIEEKNISESTARMVCDYLTKVMETRGVKASRQNRT